MQPVYERWCRENPEYPEVFALRMSLKLRAKDYPAAAEEARAGLKLGPYNYKLRAGLAAALFAQRQWAELLPAADAVLELAPRDIAVRSMRLNALLGLKRLDDAAAELERAEKDFPDRVKDFAPFHRALETLRPTPK